MYEMVGSVKLIEETQTFASGFAKREFVITTEDKYPQDVKFEATKEKIEQVDRLKEGDHVKVSFNIRGNEYKGRYYVNLQAWKIENAGGQVSPSLDAATSESNSAGGGNLDDLEESPF
ncbi:DUF3127 domain-containing protein [Pelagicoccus albus]|uniref:DUF3127 domain-containing protein n=2 Tax=Pelagicoccus albus TaxID=415222 RepID=A0A7X1E9A7_9BACT|nr:DUF3127 domain-containing protein [Pelagicoccus albus]MBC2607131.1 DUF3127 domain-containing protein [Pelagicoccus albus]